MKEDEVRDETRKEERGRTVRIVGVDRDESERGGRGERGGEIK